MRSDRTLVVSCILAALLLVAGCAGTPTAPVPRPAPGDARDTVALLALSLVGTPYRYGGADPREGFDCSGLAYYSYASNGLAIPRTSREQFHAALKIPLSQAAAGDLLFFQDQATLSHVAIYLGDGRFVHAPSSGGAVHVASIETPYYQRHLVAVGRIPFPGSSR